MGPKSLVTDGFFVHVMRDDDGACSVLVSGELDLTTADALEQQIACCIDSGVRISIDLRDVSFMDSTGLRALWSVKQLVVSQGGTLRLKALSPIVQRVLEVTHLESAFDVEPTGDA